MRLRHKVRNTHAAAIVTFPAHLYRATASGKALVSKVERCVDAVIELSGFTSASVYFTLSDWADSPELTAAFPRYSGLIDIRVLPSVGTLVPPSARLSVVRSGGQLGFRLKRRRFVVEALQEDHGAPEPRKKPDPVSVDDGDVPKSSGVRFAPKATGSIDF